jgi:hypothetical protein
MMIDFQSFIEWITNTTVLTVIGILLAAGIGIPTLYNTIQGKKIAAKAHQHQLESHAQQMNMIQPWSLTKVGKYLWVLERTYPKPAMIHQIMGDPLCYNDFNVSFKGLAGVGSPHRSYDIGEKLVLEIIPIDEKIGISSSFHLCYKEHNEKIQDVKYYSSNTSIHDEENCNGGIEWSDPLY